MLDAPKISRYAATLAKVSAFLGKSWVRISILLLCGIAARYPALNGELIWDDEYLAKGNPFIKSPLLVFETFRHHLFLDSFSTHYRPIQNISYCLDYLVWNQDTYGYHLTNILLHVSSGVLLYLLVQRVLASLSGSRGGRTDEQRNTLSLGAFLIALLWVVHPVHSAAVDYISGRADSLAALFACAAWLLYLYGVNASSTARKGAVYSLAWTCGLVAFCSRESALMWMLLFVAHRLASGPKASLRRGVPVFASCVLLVSVYAVLRHLPVARATFVPDAGPSAAERLVLMLRALGDYSRLMFFPTNLHMDRSVEAPMMLLSDRAWRNGIATEYLSSVGLLTLVVLIVGSVRGGKARVIRAFGAAWFLLAYLPISNLLNLNATVAEHWLYLPSIGFLIFLAGCCLELPTTYRRWIPAVAMVAIVALGTRSFVRSGDWINPETFYRHALRAGSSKARIALNLGQIYTDKGDYAKAEPLLRRVVALNPDYPSARNALAHLLFKQGKTEEAERLFAENTVAAEQARKEYPRTWLAALNLAHMCYNDHNLLQALEVIRKAEADYPGVWELISFEAELVRQLEGPGPAVQVVEGFARENWWHAPAAIALGKLYSEQGDVAAAEQSFRHASRLDVHSVEALNLLALLDLRQNRLAAAYKTQRQALSRQPDQPRQYLLLSDILEHMGRSDEARAALAQVSQLQAAVNAQTLAN